MTEREINRIRSRFILTSTLTLFCVMLLMGGCIYLFSAVTVRNEVRGIMRYIAANDGDLPVPSAADDTEEQTVDDSTVSEESTAEESTAEGNTAEGNTAEGNTAEEESSQHDSSFSEEMEWSLQGIFGIGDDFGEIPDFIYTTRFFAVLFSADDELEQVKTTHIAYIDDAQAEEYARIALRRRIHFGSFGRYYYYVGDRPAPAGGTIVIYLDRTAQLTLINRMLFAALAILGLGTCLSFFFMRLFSRDIVRSEIRNAEKQKQFITNASHELKTPLAVIRANTEMQEMLDGETEWTRSTMRQVDRMSGLIGNLVQIARSQEREDGTLEKIDIAAAVSETADSFVPVAASEGKTLTKEIPSSVILRTDESLIRQLTSILLGNAVKYCDENGTIRVRLEKSGRHVRLLVSNDYAEGAGVDYKRFFERFYRQDEAHTIADGTKNGYGIGLSIAESLVRTMRGTIGADWKDGVITFTCSFMAAA